MHELEFISPIAVLGIIFGSVITIIKIRTEAKLKNRLIDKGVDAELVRTLLLQRKESQIGALKWGLVMVGVGIALAIGTIVGSEQITAALMLVFGGFGFVFFYMLSEQNTTEGKSGFKF